MKKIYYAGDVRNNTGPAIVNKSYYGYLKNTTIFCSTNNKILRIIHYVLCMLFVDSIIISGFSRLNILFILIAKKMNKQTYYLMNGFVKEELKNKKEKNKVKKIKLEYEILKYVDNIICVSNFFSEYLKKIYKEFDNKIYYINNGFDIKNNINRIKHDKFTLISVGGGSRQKNNLNVCKAINNANLDVCFIVIGRLMEDGKEIKNFPFVEYYEKLTHDEVLKKMCESDLYIQNSYFETFGLSIMEALECQCDLLISKNVGALSVLENISDNDII